MQLVLLVDELHVKCLGEILTQEVACTRLQGLTVLHHGFDGVGLESTCKALVGSLDTLNDGDSHVFLSKVGIDVEHLDGLSLGLFLSGMGSVTLLPQELGGAQEHTGAHLPTEYVSPLVDEQWQIAIAVDPIAVGVPDDGLTGGTDHQFLLQTCRGVDDDTLTLRIIHQAVMGNNSALLGEAFHMISLSAQERLGNEQGEISVLHAGSLEHVIKLTLHLFPDGVAIRLDDHAATHSRLLGQVGFHYQFIIPLRVIVGSLS